eukprot:NODE_8314_length_251_cov_245.599010_g7154_i0.p3 GENE.NODE_8314_length_251_cov_245.599010_g7154_i0~~NODE_8314_length_251_cov_245.599010_g7154_i0.p3  ORF type:complete len:72 (+),score=34.90 NODE_8314_length_251_cov_245.599010_g7154_i0:32-217(+)
MGWGRVHTRAYASDTQPHARVRTTHSLAQHLVGVAKGASGGSYGMCDAGVYGVCSSCYGFF